jgi:hypothetical protein
MAFLTGGLAGIMAAHPPSEVETIGTLASPGPCTAAAAAAAAGSSSTGPPLGRSRLGVAAGQGERQVLQPAGWMALVNVDILMTCVVVAVGDLPVWESTDVEQVGEGGMVGGWGGSIRIRSCLFISVHVCSYLFISVHVCSCLFISVHTCSYLLISVHICWYLLIHHLAQSRGSSLGWVIAFLVVASCVFIIAVFIAAC